MVRSLKNKLLLAYQLRVPTGNSSSITNNPNNHQLPKKKKNANSTSLICRVLEAAIIILSRILAAAFIITSISLQHPYLAGVRTEILDSILNNFISFRIAVCATICAVWGMLTYNSTCI